jgi:hypothetical protein
LSIQKHPGKKMSQIALAHGDKALNAFTQAFRRVMRLTEFGCPSLITSKTSLPTRNEQPSSASTDLELGRDDLFKLNRKK